LHFAAGPAGPLPRFSVPTFVQILSWAIPSGILLALMGLRAATKSAPYRKDLQGAIGLIIAHLIFRGILLVLPGDEITAVHKFFAVAVRLSLAFAVLRAMVGTGLHLLRLRGYAPPNILRNVLDFTLYTLATLPVLKSQLAFDLTGVVATSAVLSVVIGLALQDTLGNLFAGLSLQLDMPFVMGDWVTIGTHTGHVVNFSWRATRIQKRTLELVTIPNNVVARESVRNHSRGGQVVAVDERVDIVFEAPPNVARAMLMETLLSCPSVLKTPAPWVRAESYQDVAVRYWVRYWVAEYLDCEMVRDEFYSRLWYRLRREGLEFPYPRRSVQMREPAPAAWPVEARAALLRGAELFRDQPAEVIDALASGLRAREWGAGERVVKEGAPGDTFYVVARGRLSVSIGPGAQVVGHLNPGDCFGEASLLTDAPRSANVDALEDVVLFEIDRPLFRRILVAQPTLAKQLSELLAAREAPREQLASDGSSAKKVHPRQEAEHIFSRLRHLFSL